MTLSDTFRQYYQWGQTFHINLQHTWGSVCVRVRVRVLAAKTPLQMPE